MPPARRCRRGPRRPRRARPSTHAPRVETTRIRPHRRPLLRGAGPRRRTPTRVDPRPRVLLHLTTTTPAKQRGRAPVTPLASGTGPYVDQLAALALAELHRALGCGEQCVVAAAPDIDAGMKARAPLADDDRARRHQGAVVDLDTKSLGIGVPAVSGGPATFGL